MSKGSTAMVISPARPASAKPQVVASVNAARTDTAIRPQSGARAASSVTGRTKRGSTVSSVRPGNHQPIMVMATKVAVSVCTTISDSASLSGARPSASSANPGTAASSNGAQRPMPKRRSMNNPQRR